MNKSNFDMLVCNVGNFAIWDLDLLGVFIDYDSMGPFNDKPELVR